MRFQLPQTQQPRPRTRCVICCKPGTSSFLQPDAATAQMQGRGLVTSPLGPGLKPPQEGQKLRGLHKVYGSHLTLNLLPAPSFPPSLSTPTFTLILLASSLHPRPMLLPPERGHLSHLWGVTHSFPSLSPGMNCSCLCLAVHFVACVVWFPPLLWPLYFQSWVLFICRLPSL